MKHYKYKLTDNNDFKLLALGDFHIGDKYCDLSSIKETLEYAKRTDNCWIILNGDLMNNALKTSKSDIYEETMTMEQEQETLIELLTPVKEKILVMSSGNHENRTNILCGINPLKYVASVLGILDRLCDNSYTIEISFGKLYGTNSPNKYYIYGTHGYGGGRRIGSVANCLEDMSAIITNADLYIHSHTHRQISWTDMCLEIYKNGIKEKQRTYYNTTAFLKYGGYAERMKLRPTCISPSVLTINAIRKQNKMLIFTDIIRI